MTNREQIFTCESCGAPIHEGDMAQFDSEGIAFCEMHAATLSEIISHWQDDLAEDEGSAGWPEYFDDPEEVRDQIEKWKARLAAEGDIKLLQEV